MQVSPAAEETVHFHNRHKQSFCGRKIVMTSKTIKNCPANEFSRRSFYLSIRTTWQAVTRRRKTNRGFRSRVKRFCADGKMFHISVAEFCFALVTNCSVHCSLVKMLIWIHLSWFVVERTSVMLKMLNKYQLVIEHDKTCFIKFSSISRHTRNLISLEMSLRECTFCAISVWSSSESGCGVGFIWIHTVEVYAPVSQVQAEGFMPRWMMTAWEIRMNIATNKVMIPCSLKLDQCQMRGCLWYEGCFWITIAGRFHCQFVGAGKRRRFLKEAMQIPQHGKCGAPASIAYFEPQSLRLTYPADRNQKAFVW